MKSKTSLPLVSSFKKSRAVFPIVFAGIGALGLGGAARAEPLAAPGFAGPLIPNAAPPAIDTGPLGTVSISGQVSGLAALQSHASHAGGIGNRDGFLDLGNAQVEIQTTTGPLQFYVQAGAYSIPSLGTSYLRATKTTDGFYGPVPVAYAKAVITPAFAVTGGLLPTLIGPESTFTFQNIAIERGLLWNQENAVNRGVQLNYAHGPVTAAVSINDGYFSGRLNWLSGSFAYAFDAANTLTLSGGGSLSRNDTSSPATPLLQNNGTILDIIYSHAAGSLTLSPYVQYSHVGRDGRLGIDLSASTWSGALLAKYAIGKNWSLGARGEYIRTTGGTCGTDPACTPTNLLYGANSRAWSLTLTPTFQRGIVFARGELSYTRIGDLESGLGFGRDLNRKDQLRGMIETGFLF
jgi:hypothetical protein